MLIFSFKSKHIVAAEQPAQLSYVNMIQCKNCHENTDGKYCRNCGQKADVAKISIPALIRDLPHAIFHIDRGLLYNFTQLFKRPGHAINEYLLGKRKPFFHPVSHLVFALVLNYLVVKMYNLHLYDEAELLTMNPLKAQAIRDYDALQWWFLEHTYIYILIAIPVSGLFLFGIFKLMKQKYNLAETSVIMLFTIAQGVLIQTIIYLCFGWSPSGPFLRTMETVNMCVLILYASIVIYQVFTPNSNIFIRFIFAFIAGAGLAAIWIASAYLLYIMLT